MNGHPGGMEHTLHMIGLGGLTPPARVLEMGAGAGEAARILRSRGFGLLALDLVPRSENVTRGDFLRSGLADGAFDGVFSQCAFYVSGDPELAFREAARVLRPGGVLMVSDVCPQGRELNLLAREAGLEVTALEDMTDLWRKYYIQAIWDGTADCCTLPRGQKFRYQLLIGRKPL